jgi:hypothetical protein
MELASYCLIAHANASMSILLLHCAAASSYVRMRAYGLKYVTNECSNSWFPINSCGKRNGIPVMPWSSQFKG